MMRAAAAVILAAFACVVLFGEFIAPYDTASQIRSMPSAPRTRIHFRDAEGRLSLRPYIYESELANALEGTYNEKPGRSYPLGLLVEGEQYRLLGLISAKTHLFGVAESGPGVPRVHLLGTDPLGRDRFSRL